MGKQLSRACSIIRKFGVEMPETCGHINREFKNGQEIKETPKMFLFRRFLLLDST